MVCRFGVGVKQVQYLIVSAVAGDILSECVQRGGWRGMVDVPRNMEEGIGVLYLQSAHC